MKGISLGINVRFAINKCLEALYFGFLNNKTKRNTTTNDRNQIHKLLKEVMLGLIVF